MVRKGSILWERIIWGFLWGPDPRHRQLHLGSVDQAYPLSTWRSWEFGGWVKVVVAKLSLARLAKKDSEVIPAHNSQEQLISLLYWSSNGSSPKFCKIVVLQSVNCDRLWGKYAATSLKLWFNVVQITEQPLGRPLRWRVCLACSNI